MCQKPALVLHVLWGKLQVVSVVSQDESGSMLSILVDCCKGGPNLHAHLSALL